MTSCGRSWISWWQIQYHSFTHKVLDILQHEKVIACINMTINSTDNKSNLTYMIFKKAVTKNWNKMLIFSNQKLNKESTFNCLNPCSKYLYYIKFKILFRYSDQIVIFTNSTIYFTKKVHQIEYEVNIDNST